LLLIITYIQVLNQIQLNVAVTDSFNNTWSYRSVSKYSLFSFAISVGLQSVISPANAVNKIKNNLRVNKSKIIPSGFSLTMEGFVVLAFQPNCKYIANNQSIKDSYIVNKMHMYIVLYISLVKHLSLS